MASIRKINTGFRAEVARKGVRSSKVFKTKQEARDWASGQEYDLINGAQIVASKSLGDLFNRYAREVSPAKRGHRWEVIRLEKLCRDPLSEVRLGVLSSQDFASWRDRRLREVAPASVIREMQLMSAALNVARKEWVWLAINPLTDVARPRKPAPRDRLPTPEEIERMRHSAGEDLQHATARAFHAFLFALETAMRSGEIVGLRAGDVSLDRRVVRLTHTKNGRPRDVPLSTEAVRLLRMLPEMDPVFDLTNRQIDVLFRKVRDRAKVTGLTFHDSRHAAITSLARQIEVLDLARMVGHTDLRMLMTYYNESAENIAKRLA